MFTKVSKTLLSIAALSFLFVGATADAKPPKIYLPTSEQGKAFPACSDGAEIGEVCVDGKGHTIVLENVNTRHKGKALGVFGKEGDKTVFTGSRVEVVYRDIKAGREKDEIEKVSDNGDGTVTVCTTVTTCKVVKKTGGGAKPGGDNVIVVDGKNPKGSGDAIIVVDSPSVYKPTRVVYRNPHDRAIAEYNKMKEFCNSYVVDAISTCGDDLESKKKSLAEAKADLADLKAKAEAEYARMIGSCRKDCIELAIDPVKAGLPAECALSKEKLAEMVDADDLKKAPDNGRADLSSTEALRKFFPPQDPLLAAINDNKMGSNLGNVCTQLIDKKKNPKCSAAVAALNPPKLGDCDAFGVYYEAQKEYLAALDAYNEVVAQVAKLEKVETSCSVRSANDVTRLMNGVGCDCLNKANDSCANAMVEAERQLQIALAQPYCATCGYDRGGPGGGGQGGCSYGGGCVSKAAQMITAVGSLAVPLGLGIMNMAMWNKGVNACTSMYGQSLEVSRQVGLPPPAPSCGGMGGFAGGFNGGGIGMNGMNGMGGIYGNMGGLNGMGGIYGNMGGLNGMGGIYGNMGGMYPGINGGISGGINFGLGNGGYNPMMGNMYGNMGGQWGGQWGGQNPMMGGQNNMYGAYQQGIDAQMRMQQIQAQNMVLQSSMNGGMYGQMGGMYGMQTSPYYNMGYQNGMNPMMNVGVTGNFNMNPWAYTSGYNPMMYAGGNGIQAGLSGGISAGFNLGAGANGYAGYNGYPSMATQPYAGYNNYGYNSGYGPYGNTGYYQPQTQQFQCGWQVGTPCI